jgi:hypothetical protein
MYWEWGSYQHHDNMALSITQAGLGSDANLQGYWKLDGNSNDSGPNGYHVDDAGSVQGYVPAKFDNGADFESPDENNGDYLSVTNANCVNLEISGSQTWLAWCKPESTPNWQHILCKYSGGANKRLILRYDTHKPFFQLPGLTTNNTVTSDVAVTIGEWSFVVGRYNSATQQLSIFHNGTWNQVDASGSATDSDGDFTIGAQVGGGVFYPFDGLIDDVAIFNRALTDEEVTSLYSGSAGGRTNVTSRTASGAKTNVSSRSSVTSRTAV